MKFISFVESKNKVQNRRFKVVLNFIAKHKIDEVLESSNRKKKRNFILINSLIFEHLFFHFFRRSRKLFFSTLFCCFWSYYLCVTHKGDFKTNNFRNFGWLIIEFPMILVFEADPHSWGIRKIQIQIRNDTDPDPKPCKPANDPTGLEPISARPKLVA